MQNYFKVELEKSKNNAHHSWRLIKSLISSKANKSHFPEKLIRNDFETTNFHNMAEIFNDCFCTFGKNLADKFPVHKDNNFKKFLGTRISPSLFLTSTTPLEILNRINSLKNSKSCGLDKISSYFLKVAANALAFPLSYLFNFCLKLGIFSDCLKIAKVIPIFKSGNKSDTTNYRPISILSPISKILEKIIYSRTTAFFDKHSVFLPLNSASDLNIQLHTLY